MAGVARQKDKKDETEDNTMQGGGQKNLEKSKWFRRLKGSSLTGKTMALKKRDTPTAEDISGVFFILFFRIEFCLHFSHLSRPRRETEDENRKISPMLNRHAKQ